MTIAQSGPILFVDLLAFGFGEKNFRGGDRLADVALGVVGDVNEQAAERRWQRLFADRSRLLEVRFRQMHARGERRGPALTIIHRR